MEMVEWFNGTHLVRVFKDDTRKLGINIKIAMADANGEPVSEWHDFRPEQGTWWKDQAEILAEGIRYTLG